MKDGSIQNIKSIPPSTSVFCPIHIDKKPSAFTVKSRNDAIGIHCSSCSLTYWYDDPEDYVLDEFDQLIQRLNETDFSTQKLPNRQNIKITTSNYLNHIEYRAGVHCIKSPKGSGKTEILKSIVSSIQKQEFSKSVPRKNRSKTVLLIGHRQTLLREAAHKLNLDCYLDQKSTTNFYAVCLDSLFSKLKRNEVKYDFVILDECEQVFQHILSKTFEDRIGIENSWNALNYALKRAKSIIALDADLGFLTINTLRNIRTKDWEKDFYITYNSNIIDDQVKKISNYIRVRIISSVI